MLQEDAPASGPDRENVTEILRAAKQAGVLTRRLLAFGAAPGGKSPSYSTSNDAVTSGQTMLQRLAGEHVTIQTLLETGPLPVQLDPGQLEQVVLNLAVKRARCHEPRRDADHRDASH